MRSAIVPSNARCLCLVRHTCWVPGAYGCAPIESHRVGGRSEQESCCQKSLSDIHECLAIDRLGGAADADAFKNSISAEK